MVYIDMSDKCQDKQRERDQTLPGVQDIECFPSSQAQNFKVLQKVRTSLPTILTQSIP